ncbi:glycosyltransferase [Paraburkholderia sp. SIMBA_030]|uniref:glycosyltransferase n=1 Tax=Paraburkholderia sp. SIMBA_030 TaxID=3085773 RepID=UPI0039795E58
MATYNGSRFLPEQLMSLAAQSVLPAELVVTDDGSTDGTVDLIERFAEHAPFPVRVYRNPQRLCYADNFLRATSLCQGEWIAFCDQDDVWLNNKLELVRHAASRRGVSMVVHPVRTVDAALQKTPGEASCCRVRHGRGPHRLPPFGFFAGLCVTFDAALVPLLLQPPRGPGSGHGTREPAHDQWACALADAAGTVRYIPQPLVLYRQHGENTCGADARERTSPLNQASWAGASSYQYYAEQARRYQEAFRTLADSPEGRPWREQLERAALRYGRTHDYLISRASLHLGAGRLARIQTVAALGARWSYRFNPVRSPLQAFIKDLYVSILRPPRARGDVKSATAVKR